SRRRHTRFSRDWSSDVCSSDLLFVAAGLQFDILKLEVFLVEDRRTICLRPFPGGDVGVVLVIAHGLAFRGLVFLAEVAAARFVRSEERRVGKEWRSRRARVDAT